MTPEGYHHSLTQKLINVLYSLKEPPGNWIKFDHVELLMKIY